MIDLYYWATPNGQKILLFLEEAGAAYRIAQVNIKTGEQRRPEFVAISPNGRIPAIVDHAPTDGGPPQPVFESGAILVYLAEKLGRFLPADPRGRIETLKWLFWQVGGLGPMAGQFHHFADAAPQKIPYAIDRYVREIARLYAVMDARLARHAFLAGEDYTVADMAAYPWVVLHPRERQDLDGFPNLKHWFETIAARPAVRRAYARLEAIKASGTAA